ncbi:MAG TPA: hypothetical protein VIA62_26805 [Thermoanaerobaculia bacterium]|jgi:hypothetical protein|nr:hypothetical protein [Thermoanaerobaculia bacterium]
MKRPARKLSLNRETLRHLDGTELQKARGAQTLTYEREACEDTWDCTPPDTGCTSTLSCTQ